MEKNGRALTSMTVRNHFRPGWTTTSHEEANYICSFGITMLAGNQELYEHAGYTDDERTFQAEVVELVPRPSFWDA